MKSVYIICSCLLLASTGALAQCPSSINLQGEFAPRQSHGMLLNLSRTPQGLRPIQAESAAPDAWTTLSVGSRRRQVESQVQTGPEQVLYALKGGSDGQYSCAGLIFDSLGNLYGTTISGGNGTTCLSRCGTVFELAPNGSGGWTETVLYSFQGGSDGAYPSSGLIFDQSGNLYGTAYGGGGSGQCYAGCGTVFELRRNGSGGWKETILYSFQGGNDGANPSSGLIFDRTGNLYGTTEWSVFELSPSGSGGWTETTLLDFGGSAFPSGLIFDQSGNLYGTTYVGGSGNCHLDVSPHETYGGCGTAFELSPNGSGGWTDTVLYNFLGLFSTQGGNDGAYPSAGLTFDKTGNLYGTTVEGGIAGCAGNVGCGTVFELSPSGSGGWTETVLHRFQGIAKDGAYPYSGLIFDQSGSLYGTAYYGGSGLYGWDGTVFELSPNGSGGWVDTTLYSFQAGNDGSNPASGLVIDQSGSLYGTTVAGGGTGCGGGGCGVVYEVFKVPSGTFSPTNITFGNQAPGASSSPQVVTLTNSGRLPLTISSIGITGTNSGDFAQTNNCPSSLAQSSSCNISVTFTPTAGGNRQAELQVADNAPGSPQGAALSGTGEDFSLSVTSQTSLTVTAGQAANYTIAVSPISGFAQKVALNCSGAPPESTCSISPSSVTLDGTHSPSANVAVVTSGASAGLVHPAGFTTSSRFALWLAFSGLPGLLLLGGGVRKRYSRALCWLLPACVLLLVITWSGCGGGSSGSSGGGTPPGTYTLAVTGTYTAGSVNLVNSTKLTLVVQ